MKRLLPVLILVFLALAVQIAAESFTDTSTDDFNLGTRFQTAVSLGNLTLSNQTSTAYYTQGNFTSRTFDAGHNANWTEISWSSVKSENHTLSVRFSTSDDGSSWSSWSSSYPSSPALISSLGRYLRYSAELATLNNQNTPVLESVTVYYSFPKPTVLLLNPPADHTSTTGSLSFSCSAQSVNNLSSITFFWNYSGSWQANETRSVNGTSATSYFDRSGLENGTTFIWSCFAQDTAGRSSWGPNRTVSINLAPGDTSPPEVNYSIIPKSVLSGEPVTFLITASDPSGLGSISLGILLPDSTTQTINVTSGTAFNYTSNQPGTHQVTITARDTLGNQRVLTDSFSVSTLVPLNINITDSNSTGIMSSLALYYPGTGIEVNEWESPSGRFTQDVVGGEYDILFSAHNDTVRLLLRGITLSEDTSGEVGLEALDEPSEGFRMTFGFRRSLDTGNSSISFVYDEGLFANENYVELSKCDNWSFSNNLCFGSWEAMPSSLDTAQNIISAEIGDNSVGGFSIRQAGYCGDNICSGAENANSCPSDCECNEGSTRVCGTTDVGPCEFGTQTCTSGTWGPCEGQVAPSPEVCNQIDDDCDGLIDDVEGGTSIQETRCQCYAGGPPKEEGCNSLDDDCDGEIDEDVTRNCGSNVGVCEFGVSTCVNGIYGECYGGIKPSEEICFNSLDDNCDGQTDEGCPNCSNGIMDGDEEGVDCGGSCSNTCPELPWMYLVIVGILLVVGLAAYWFLFRRKPMTWADLEQKYRAPSYRR